MSDRGKTARPVAEVSLAVIWLGAVGSNGRLVPHHYHHGRTLLRSQTHGGFEERGEAASWPGDHRQRAAADRDVLFDRGEDATAQIGIAGKAGMSPCSRRDGGRRAPIFEISDGLHLGRHIQDR